METEYGGTIFGGESGLSRVEESGRANYLSVRIRQLTSEALKEREYFAFEAVFTFSGAVF